MKNFKLDLNTIILLFGFVLIAFIMLAVTGLIPISHEALALLGTALGGAVLYALRTFVGELQTNTSLTQNAHDKTHETAENVERLNKLVAENSRLQLCNEQITRVLNEIRAEPDCAHCVEIITKRLTQLK